MCFEEPERVRRHVARQRECASGDRGNTGFCIRSKILIWLGDFKTGVIHQVAGNGRSITKLVLPEKENPSGRRRRPFQLNLHYQRKKIHLVAGDGCSITSHVLGENENPSCMLLETAMSILKYYQRMKNPSVLPVLNLYYQRTKIHPVAGNNLRLTSVSM